MSIEIPKPKRFETYTFCSTEIEFDLMYVDEGRVMALQDLHDTKTIKDIKDKFGHDNNYSWVKRGHIFKFNIESCFETRYVPSTRYTKPLKLSDEEHKYWTEYLKMMLM